MLVPIRLTHKTNNSNTGSKCELCCCMCRCLTLLPWPAVTIYVSELDVSQIPELSVFIIPGGTVMCVTKEGQEETVHMHQVQEIHLQHTHSKPLSLMWCVDRP
jgi:hypothetical protein